ncbi:hypothetical protein FQN54_007637 [Arachnomyces sp. PD_36]|nr:hypothetical protein FQN54_007637 [Arachnomyces sp. PD_36]
MKFSVASISVLVSLATALPRTPAVEKRAALEPFVGTNAYWLPFLTDDADVDKTFQALNDAGLKVVRTWGFNDATDCNEVHFQCWSGSTPTINTGANGLQRLDSVVRSAEAHDVQLIIPFVNNWGDYGGMDVYVSALGGADHNAFYTDAAIQDAYKNYASTIVNRYKNSTAIYAWELGNEPRCTGCEASVITKWATTMSAYIKSLDSDHMVTLGDEGFFNRPGDPSYPYQGGDGVDFEANLKIETLDFGTFHLYTESWGQNYEWGNQWIADHADACAAAGKSCVFEEYGVPEDGATRDRVMAEWHDTILANATDIPADLYWQFGLTLSAGKTHDDTYTIYVDEDNFQTLVVDWAVERTA